jgi:hypothetical protein
MGPLDPFPLTSPESYVQQQRSVCPVSRRQAQTPDFKEPRLGSHLPLTSPRFGLVGRLAENPLLQQAPKQSASRRRPRPSRPLLGTERRRRTARCPCQNAASPRNVPARGAKGRLRLMPRGARATLRPPDRPGRPDFHFHQRNDATATHAPDRTPPGSDRSPATPPPTPPPHPLPPRLLALTAKIFEGTSGSLRVGRGGDLGMESHWFDTVKLRGRKLREVTKRFIPLLPLYHQLEPILQYMATVPFPRVTSN